MIIAALNRRDAQIGEALVQFLDILFPIVGGAMVPEPCEFLWVEERDLATTRRTFSVRSFLVNIFQSFDPFSSLPG